MRILILENNDQLRSLLKEELQAESFAVDTIEDSATACYLARVNDYDLIVAGGVKCREFSEEVRITGKTTPIIILAEKCDAPTKAKLLNMGVDDYLEKPFSLEELFARIRALLRRGPRFQDEVLRVDDLMLNTAKQEAQRGKKAIYLTRKEFNLLEFLMRNKNRIVTRGMIFEHVWNGDSNPFSNTIEAHIFNLRRKIDCSKKCKLIHNIPGRGYKLDVKRF